MASPFPLSGGCWGGEAGGHMHAPRCPTREAPGTEKAQVREGPTEAGPHECRSKRGGSCSSRPETRTDSSLRTSPPSLPEAGACGTAGCPPAGSLALGQVHEPICFLPAFYSGIKYGMHTPRHTHSHGNQTTGPTLPSPTQSTLAPGRLPDTRDVRQGPIRTTCPSEWEMRGNGTTSTIL